MSTSALDEQQATAKPRRSDTEEPPVLHGGAIALVLLQLAGVFLGYATSYVISSVESE